MNVYVVFLRLNILIVYLEYNVLIRERIDHYTLEFQVEDVFYPVRDPLESPSCFYFITMRIMKNNHEFFILLLTREASLEISAGKIVFHSLLLMLLIFTSVTKKVPW